MELNHYSYLMQPITTKSFGTLPDGREVSIVTLTNKNGMSFSALTYGAAITSLRIPMPDETENDVVLGFDSLQKYIDSFSLESAPYLGAVIGRYAGRIRNGKFTLNGTEYQLPLNHGNHHLHGGNTSFSGVLWQIKEIHDGENPSVTFSYVSADNEENYPGELTVEAKYMLTENNELNVRFSATTTKDTIINLTQHSYFNLDGHRSDISDQLLKVNADKMLETNVHNIPTGNLMNIRNSRFDYANPTASPKSLDNTFVIKDYDNPAAVLYSKSKKLRMSVFTNQPAVHIYVGGNCFGKIKGKENAAYHSQSAICFETQNFPDAPNHEHFPNAILKKGDLYMHETKFKFETI
jgi:aldose 1-epimerase